VGFEHEKPWMSYQGGVLDAHWCWGIHLSLAMPGKDSTALNIELALDESLTHTHTHTHKNIKEEDSIIQAV
jgi:hypothetical protein